MTKKKTEAQSNEPIHVHANIKITINNTEHEISVEDARILRNLLTNILGQDPQPVMPVQPWTWPTHPPYIGDVPPNPEQPYFGSQPGIGTIHLYDYWKHALPPNLRSVSSSGSCCSASSHFTAPPVTPPPMGVREESYEQQTER